jgi:hypothetical protein
VVSRNGDTMRPQGRPTTPDPDPTERTIEQSKDDVRSLRELLETRIAGGEKVSDLLAKAIAAVPETIGAEVGHLKELHGEKLRSMAELLKVHVESIKDQINAFNVASKTAVDAAFLAQKNVADVMQKYNEATSGKTETTFAESLKQLTVLVTKMDDYTKTQMRDLKENQDRGEGKGTVIGWIFGGGIALVSLIVASVVAFSPHTNAASDANTAAIAKLVDLLTLQQRVAPVALPLPVTK